MTIGARIKQWRAKNNLKQDQACSLIGLSFSTYQKYEMDVSKPGSDALEAFASIGININWLLTGEGEMLLGGSSIARDIELFNETERQPIAYGRVEDAYQQRTAPPPASLSEFAMLTFYDVEASAGHGALVDQEQQISQMAFRKDWLQLKGLQASKCALIKAKGDSMEPTIYDGDLLLVDTSIDAIKDDSIYIVQTDHHLIVKRIQQGLDGSLTIISDNNRYREQVISSEQAKEVKIAGRVRWCGHEM